MDELHSNQSAKRDILLSSKTEPFEATHNILRDIGSSINYQRLSSNIFQFSVSTSFIANLIFLSFERFKNCEKQKMGFPNFFVACVCKNLTT